MTPAEPEPPSQADSVVEAEQPTEVTSEAAEQPTEVTSGAAEQPTEVTGEAAVAEPTATTSEGEDQ